MHQSIRIRWCLFFLVLCTSPVGFLAQSSQPRFPVILSPGQTRRALALRIRYICDPTQPTFAWGPLTGAQALNMSWDPEDTSVCPPDTIARAQYPSPSNSSFNSPRIRKLFITAPAPNGWQPGPYDAPYAYHGIDYYTYWAKTRNPPAPAYLSAPIDRASGKLCVVYHGNAFEANWLYYLYENDLHSGHPDVACFVGQDEVRLGDAHYGSAPEFYAPENFNPLAIGVDRDMKFFFESMINWGQTPGDEFKGLVDQNNLKPIGHSIAVVALTAYHGWINASIKPYDGPGKIAMGSCKDCSEWMWGPGNLRGMSGKIVWHDSQDRDPEQGPVRGQYYNINKNYNPRLQPAGTSHMMLGGPSGESLFDAMNMAGLDTSDIVGGYRDDNSTIITRNSIETQWYINAVWSAWTLHGNSAYRPLTWTPNMYAQLVPGITINGKTTPNQYVSIPYGDQCDTLATTEEDLGINSGGSASSSSGATSIETSLNSYGSVITSYENNVCFADVSPPLTTLDELGLLAQERAGTLHGVYCTQIC